jgi:hypothetical protein
VDHLALQVGQVHDVVVDDAKRADAGGGQIEGCGRAQAPRAQQQHLRVQELLLTLGADLGQQQVAAVALALLSGQRAGGLDVVAAVLPQREATRHRLDVLIAQIVEQGSGGPRGSVARLAVEDDVLGAIGRGALDPGLEIGLGHVLGARDVAGAPLLRLAHVDDQRAVGRLLAHDRGIDFFDPALDLAENLGSGRTHG